MKTEFNPLDPQERAVIRAFLDTLDLPAEEKPKTKTTKAEPKKPAKPEPEPEAPKEKPKPVGNVTIDQIRTKLAEKVGDHRTEIKDKLTALKANNVSSLDPDYYFEFYSFLEDL